jgi:hypothetical protein
MHGPPSSAHNANTHPCCLVTLQKACAISIEKLISQCAPNHASSTVVCSPHMKHPFWLTMHAPIPAYGWGRSPVGPWPGSGHWTILLNYNTEHSSLKLFGNFQGCALTHGVPLSTGSCTCLIQLLVPSPFIILPAEGPSLPRMLTVDCLLVTDQPNWSLSRP